MTESIPLIDKSDLFEQIRDRISEILAAEIAAQQALASGAGKDPELYTIRVYAERINPWEAFGDDKTPLANVWYDSSRYDPSRSNSQTRQVSDPSRYHIDVYSYAESEDVAGGGHRPGDELGAKRGQHAAKLVRNLLMHDKWRKLGLGNDIWDRWIASIEMFQPVSGKQAVQHVVGCRVTLEVKHNETIELEEHEILELINVKFHHEPDGQVIAELNYGEETP